MGWKHAMENLWFSTDGVFGRPVEVVSRTVLVFIVFGAVLQQSGAGAVLLRIAMAATGRFAGGPAHAAVAASALFGSLSGTAVANVVSTGVFTIPIIKKIGFRPSFAGAVEAAASTGGQIMPPVMGVVAFLMADITGIPYIKIIVAALIPSIMYYSSLFIVVFIEAKRLGVEPLAKEQRVALTKDDLLKSLALVVPLGVIITVLITGRTAQNAGFYALISAFVLCLLLFPDFRKPAKWWRALVDSGKTCAVLMVIVSAIGFVIGVINMTGIGLMFAEAVLSVASSNLWLALVFVMLSCLVMGMGVPTGAAYLMIAIVLGPVLQKLGLSLMAAHLFVVYFGVLSVVTPPVALAAFAAAPIAEANPMETGLQATRLAIAGFIIPYMFVFHPDILLVVGDFHLGGLLWALFVFFVSSWGIATGLGGVGVGQAAPLATGGAAVGGGPADRPGRAVRAGGGRNSGWVLDIESAVQARAAILIGSLTKEGRHGQKTNQRDDAGRGPVPGHGRPGAGGQDPQDGHHSAGFLGLPNHDHHGHHD